MQIEKTHHLSGLNTSCVSPECIIRLGATHHAFLSSCFSAGYFKNSPSGPFPPRYTDSISYLLISYVVSVWWRKGWRKTFVKCCAAMQNYGAKRVQKVAQKIGCKRVDANAWNIRR